MRILVADDEATSRLIASSAIRKLGHECVTVSDGDEAWKAFQASRFDAIISDWRMPGLTGPELCRQVRGQAGSSYTYFIMVSALGAGQDILGGMDAGADDYLVKPLDVDQLRFRLVAASRVTLLHHQLGEQRVELERLNTEHMGMARRDALTGLGNRLAMREDLEILEARVARYGHSYGILLFDVDHFKSYNDTYGHIAGDTALQAVASEISRQARGGDAVYRYGGEEFLAILPEQSLDAGSVAAERMRSGVEHLAVPHVENPPFGVLTVSAGLAALVPSHLRPVGDVLREADAALYQAKRLGRNRVEFGVSR
jgi:diguanylate cyclase (GGDEF)-like protein